MCIAMEPCICLAYEIFSSIDHCHNLSSHQEFYIEENKLLISVHSSFNSIRYSHVMVFYAHVWPVRVTVMVIYGESMNLSLN